MSEGFNKVEINIIYGSFNTSGIVTLKLYETLFQKSRFCPGNTGNWKKLQRKKGGEKNSGGGEHLVSF